MKLVTRDGIIWIVTSMTLTSTGLKYGMRLPSEDLQVVDADVDAIGYTTVKFYALYREVAESAGFNLVDLHQGIL
ncbi:MAG: hypothetical protein U0T81_10310 [Saprospiraceae bacterium]